jgi:hypothetical protein
LASAAGQGRFELAAHERQAERLRQGKRCATIVRGGFAIARGLSPAPDAK